MTPSVKEAAKLASTLALRGIVHEAILAHAIDRKAARDSLEWELKSPTIKWAIMGREITVLLPFTVALKSKGTVVYALSVTFRSTYDVVAGAPIPKAKDIDHYVGIAAVLQVWPYVREEMQMLSMKLSQGSPVILPNIVADQLPDTVEVSRMRSAARSDEK